MHIASVHKIQCNFTHTHTHTMERTSFNTWSSCIKNGKTIPIQISCSHNVDILKLNLQFAFASKIFLTYEDHVKQEYI